MILQFKLKTVWKTSWPYCMTLKTHWLDSFAWKAIVCTTKVRDETFRNGESMKIKHSVSSSLYKVWGNVFRKKALHGRTKVLDKFMGESFTWGLMIRPCKGELINKRLQRSRQVSFPLIDPNLGDWYIIWKLTPQIGIEFEKHLFHTMPLLLWISCKACPLFFLNRGDLFFDALIIGLF